MKLFAAFALVLAGACHAQAQDAAAERERIKVERAAADARHAEAQKACRAKFAVNDCLAEARRAHNAAESELKRQERLLDEAERKHRAIERQKDLDERKAAREDQDAAEKRAKALADQEDRERRSAEKAAKRAADDAERRQRGPRAQPAEESHGPQGSPREPQPPKATGPTASEAAKNRAAYEARVQEAERHKAEVAARNAKKTKPPAADLPPPPR